MNIKINCMFNDRGAWCTNTDIKRSLYGMGARLCSEYPPMHDSTCALRVTYKKPPSPPPARSVTGKNT